MEPRVSKTPLILALPLFHWRLTPLIYKHHSLTERLKKIISPMQSIAGMHNTYSIRIFYKPPRFRLRIAPLLKSDKRQKLLQFNDLFGLTTPASRLRAGTVNVSPSSDTNAFETAEQFWVHDQLYLVGFWHVGIWNVLPWSSKGNTTAERFC